MHGVKSERKVEFNGIYHFTYTSIKNIILNKITQKYK